MLHKDAVNINSPVWKHNVRKAVGVGVQQWELQSFAQWRNRWEKLARGGWIPVKKKVTAERDRQHVRHILLPLCLTPSFLFHCNLSLLLFSQFASLPVHFSILLLPNLTLLSLFSYFPSFYSLYPGVYGVFSHQTTNIRVLRGFSLVHMWWEGFGRRHRVRQADYAANPPTLTTELLISNRGMANILYI